MVFCNTGHKEKAKESQGDDTKMKRGFFCVVEKCCSRGADSIRGCPFFSRTYCKDGKTRFVCIKTGIPYRRLSEIPLPEVSEKWDGKFPDWCPLEKKYENKRPQKPSYPEVMKVSRQLKENGASLAAVRKLFWWYNL